jgi:cell division protease FtsH
MTEKSDPKKGFPNSFLFFLMAVIAIVLMAQTFVDVKFAKVAFSYQLEHLVNLRLVETDKSKKTALNDNLVSFSGKFRERATEEGKKRYKYLEFLNINHELNRDLLDADQDLANIRKKIQVAADWFLKLSGKSLPKDGFFVVADSYDSLGMIPGVTLKNLSGKKIESLPSLMQKLENLKANPSEEGVNDFSLSLRSFLNNVRSPFLGIGVDSIKEALRRDNDALNQMKIISSTPVQNIKTFDHVLGDVEGIFAQIDSIQDGGRFNQLRSVRNYKEAKGEYNLLVNELEDNKVQLERVRDSVSHVIWFFNGQELSSRSLEKQDPEMYHHWFIKAQSEWENFSVNKGGVFKAPDQPLNTVLEKTFKSEVPAPNYMSYLFTFLPVILIVVVLYFLFARQMKGAGGGAMSFGKSPAKLMDKDKNKVTFKDVAGLEEATEELEEIVDFLKSPQKFTALGGRIPKGVLLIGPPGTGKTLTAKAVAGEASCPFFSISGSDFVEMFVGVGASRIRDMFEQAKKNAPCIIFMDEIDAVGRHRGAGVGGGHDEREQTLNQLLVEMDGFDSNEGVILMAATNRPDVLDKALLRPGRFDRRVILNLPDVKGRHEILKVHAKKIKLDQSVELLQIAKSTPGSSGADLENLLNEAALLAARKGRRAVTEQEVKDARDKVLYGKERRSLEVDEDEKRTTAYHESGHAVVGLVVEHGDTVDKVTIIPRGMSLGSTMFLPEKNKTSYWKKEIVDRLAVLMGGRCAEEIFVKDVSSGAKQDIEQATQLARSMVCEWGMSEKLGPVAYDERSEGGQFLGGQGFHEKKYSEATARQIDDEVRDILDEANSYATKIIKKHRTHLELMTDMLMEFETLDKDDVKLIINDEWDTDKKRERLKLAEEAHKPVPPPSPKKEMEGDTKEKPILVSDSGDAKPTDVMA